jgi:hypothetical protein
MTKNIFFSLIFLGFAACRVQEIGTSESAQQDMERARAAAALVGLEDSVEMFIQIRPATAAELRTLPSSTVEDDYIDFFAQQRKEVNKETIFRRWWQERKTVKSMEEYYQVMEKYPPMFEAMDEKYRISYEKAKSEHLTSGKYGLYREKKDSVVEIYELKYGIPLSGIPLSDK